MMRLEAGAVLTAVAAAFAVVVASAAGATAAGSVSGIVGGDRITTFAGEYKFGSGGFSGDGGLATKAQLSQPAGVAVDKAGNVYIADSSNHVIRKVTTDGKIHAIAGGGDGGVFNNGAISGPALEAHFNHPTGLALDAQGNVFIADSNFVFKLTPSGTLSYFAGDPNGADPVAPNLGDGGPALKAQVNPYGIALDSKGNLYIADDGNQRVRKVDSAGIITTVAGGGPAGKWGDGGPATKAHLTDPLGVAVDKAGNLYIADQFPEFLRKVSPNGMITTFAGIGGYHSFDESEGHPATKVPLSNPFGVALDAHGNVYVAEDARVRKISADGTITTVAGQSGRRLHELSTGSGDGGPAILATLAHPVGIAFDQKGNLYIADVAEASVRKVWIGTARPTTPAPKTKPHAKPKPSPKPAGSTSTEKAVLNLTSRIEIDLTQMTAGRAKLKAALGHVANCTLSPTTAAAQVAAVAASRQQVLRQLAALPAPTAQALQVKTLLQAALTHSIAADLHYRDWLASQRARCPTSSNGNLSSAQHEDQLATAAKESFLAAFNPLARQQHERTWKAGTI